MKSKMTLSLIEQVIMIAVFAIAATAALRVFVYAEKLSGEKELRDFALTEAQNAAECLKNTGGDFAAAAALLEAEPGSGGFTLAIGEAASAAASAENNLTLQALPADSGSPYLGAAEITVTGADGALCSLQVYWQEGTP